MAAPVARNVEYVCSRCPAGLVLEGVPVPSGQNVQQTNAELWDDLAPHFIAHGWSVRTAPSGGRFALCPSCAQEHQPTDTAPLKPFDPRARCRMCGCNRITMRYCNGLNPCHAGAGNRHHLHRACTRCGYGWVEAPKEESNEPTVRDERDPAAVV